MSLPTWIHDVFAAVDRSDPDSFVGHLTADARFIFGNAPAVEGAAAIRTLLQGFFASIRHTRHEVQAGWVVDDHAIVRGVVTYTRHDGSTYSVPFANFFTMVGGKIGDYRIFVDNHELYTAPA